MAVSPNLLRHMRVLTIYDVTKRVCRVVSSHLLEEIGCRELVVMEPTASFLGHLQVKENVALGTGGQGSNRTRKSYAGLG